MQQCVRSPYGALRLGNQTAVCRFPHKGRMVCQYLFDSAKSGV